MISDAMILAAGLGTRMRPLTDKRPKPLVDVAGTTLLDHALDTLHAAGIDQAVVNVHYLPEQIEAHVAARSVPRTRISDERALLLETGGGVANALPLLQGDAFVVMNADNMWIEDPDDGSVITPLLEVWDDALMDVLLLVVPVDAATGYDGAGDFFLDGDGRLRRRGEAPRAPYAYAGIHITRRALFDGVVVEPFSLNRLWDQAIAQERMFALVQRGHWYHVGTPEAVALANAELGHG
jgi:N-acetyl-alpha-D-muramate 1-phosphate uridylyltransferase